MTKIELEFRGSKATVTRILPGADPITGVAEFMVPVKFNPDLEDIIEVWLTIEAKPYSREEFCKALEAALESWWNRLQLKNASEAEEAKKKEAEKELVTRVAAFLGLEQL